MGLRDRAELSASSNGSTYRQAGPLDLKTQGGHAMQTPNDYDSNLPSSNPAPPLQNSMFSLEKRGFGDDAGDSLDDSPGSKAAHKTVISTGGSTCRHGHAWIGRKAKAIGQKCEKPKGSQESRKWKVEQSCGEDRNRTFVRFHNVL